MVSRRRLRDPEPRWPIFFGDVECTEILGALPYSAASRVRARFCLSSGGGTSGSDRPLATWRSGLRGPAATPGCHLLEHCRRAPRESRLGPHFRSAVFHGPIV